MNYHGCPIIGGHYTFQTSEWSEGATYEVYLQGSYGNDTNIRGSSDVDIVMQLTSVFWNNLSQDDKAKLGLTTVPYSLNDFKREVISALQSCYGNDLVDTTGSKSVKVLASGNRLKADIVVCATYKYFENLKTRAEGITFWTSYGAQIINYPKLHRDNGTRKNTSSRTAGSYKPGIRVFKNARDRIIDQDSGLDGRFPSYFVECLLYNVPDSKFAGTSQDMYVEVVNWLNDRFNDDACGKYVCQNEMQYLFGPEPVQWNQADAIELVTRLIALWNNR